MRRSTLIRFAVLIPAAVACAHDSHSIEYVAEHLPEVAMDNRYAVLPLEGGISAGYTQIHSQTLSNDGFMSAVGLRRQRGPWSLTGFVFYDRSQLDGGTEHRPLDVLFNHDVPYAMPVNAEFTGLSGSARDAGVGIALGRAAHLAGIHDFTWSVGLLWQQVSLTDYRFDYR